MENKRKITVANRRLAKKRVQCLNEALCFVSSSVLADSLVLRNPLLRQAPNRYASCKKMKFGKHILLGLVSVTLFACDAVNHLHYSVQNRTYKNIRIHVPNYPIDPNQGEFSAKVDTIIEIKPNESLWVGTSLMDINFPWATKNIYKESPGICGLELIENDTLVELDCTKSSWKYKKRWSTLKIK